MKFLSEFLLYTQCYKFQKNNQFLTVLFIIRQNFIEFYWHENQILNFFCEVSLIDIVWSWKQDSNTQTYTAALTKSWPTECIYY